MRKSILVLLALALVLALGGSAFAAKNSLVVADQYDATMFDPIRHNDYPSSRACHQVYDTLIFLNDDGTFRPGLAEKWEFVSDTAYKMTLRKGVKFHNGDEMKAEDVKFSLERANTPRGAQIHEYSQDLDNVEIVDDYTVILHLKKVNFPFFASLAHSWGSIVNKKEETSVLIEAVERALEGRATGSFDWATALDEDEDFTKRLTASKLEVLRLYAGGLSAKQVAHRLDLALNTVNKYVSEIKDEYRKAGRLSRGDRVALFREAVHDGILPD